MYLITIIHFSLLYKIVLSSEFTGLQYINDCGLTYTLQSHFALENVLHLIPENVLISGDDQIPGVSEVGTDTGMQTELLKK